MPKPAKQTILFLLPLLSATILVVACRSIPTGNERENDSGIVQQEVTTSVCGLPLPFSSHWVKKPTAFEKVAKQVKEPLRYAQWLLLGGLILSAGACMYFPDPTRQKRLAKVAGILAVLYLCVIAFFVFIGSILGHPWWIAGVVVFAAATGCFVFWKKNEEEIKEFLE